MDFFEELMFSYLSSRAFGYQGSSRAFNHRDPMKIPMNDPSLRWRLNEPRCPIKGVRMNKDIESMYMSYIKDKATRLTDKLADIREKEADTKKKSYPMEITDVGLWDYRLVLRAKGDHFIKQPSKSQFYKSSIKQAVKSLYKNVREDDGQQQVGGDEDQIEMSVRVLDLLEEFGTDNGDSAIRATHLLACYAKADGRFSRLACIIKVWKAKKFDKLDTMGAFPSYAFVLMVIQFLQLERSASVLPCLHKMYPKVFERNLDAAALPDMQMHFRSNSSIDMGRLLTGFFNYYRWPENWSAGHSPWRISVRDGKPKFRNGPMTMVGRKPVNYEKFMIEDPFSLENVAHVDWPYAGPKPFGSISVHLTDDISFLLNDVMVTVHVHLYYRQSLAKLMDYDFEEEDNPVFETEYRRIMRR